MKNSSNKFALLVFALGALFLSATSLFAQLSASHASTTSPSAGGVNVNDKPVARVNGSVLTNRDLLREMFAMFPYARQHNGFPKEMEPEIRKGALDMIIFEELVYQEGLRRNILISDANINAAAAEFRKQFPSAEKYQEYLKVECGRSSKVLRNKIRRSLTIEAVLKTEVFDKSRVSVSEARAFYVGNPAKFEHGEAFALQTISIIPPPNATPEFQKEAAKRAAEALKQAKMTNSYRDFGVLAEKLSDDDWHVNMGDRKTVEAATLPPPIVDAARKMQIGSVSELFQFGSNYTLFRLNSRTPAGKAAFEDVRKRIESDLQKSKVEARRSDFNKRLRKNAKVELL